MKEVRKQADAMEMTGSFMHLHLGIPAEGLPADLECHHSVLNLSTDVTAEQNLVIVSIPTIFDPTLAPEGYHIIHAYTAASENFVDWDFEYWDLKIKMSNKNIILKVENISKQYRLGILIFLRVKFKWI